jgi:hypothetical protein
MEMEQIIEYLLAEIRTTQEEMRSGHGEMIADMSTWRKRRSSA